MDWNIINEKFILLLKEKNVFLGGDILTPYLLAWKNSKIHVCYLNPHEIRDPPFIQFLFQNTKDVTFNKNNIGYTYFSVSGILKEFLSSYLVALPSVLLVGLGNRENYQFIRLNLGVSRLTQWLRYCGVAKVYSIDFFLEDSAYSKLNTMISDIVFDIIGFSANFGQWEQLKEAIKQISINIGNTKIIFGNILPAFSYDEIKKISPNKNFVIAKSFGESILRETCQELISKNIDNRILWLEDIQDNEYLIYPDEKIINETYKVGGHLSIETSLGCVYGRCSFCPRSHRGKSWARKNIQSFEYIIKRIITYSNKSPNYLSIVDEDFFGNEESCYSIDNKVEKLSDHELIMQTCRENDVIYEIYTRVNNIFSRDRTLEWNLRRAKVLFINREYIKRVFIGVESGANPQLERYNKGQTVCDIVDTIRVASSLGVNLEYGFITFDPLMTPNELIENIKFLSRRDIICEKIVSNLTDVEPFIVQYINLNSFSPMGIPLYSNVGYMATELELLKNSEYCLRLFKEHKDLYSGQYDPNFARHEFFYLNKQVECVAGYCRVWTQGFFKYIYKNKLKMRVLSATEGKIYRQIYTKYQKATFFLLCIATYKETRDVELFEVLNIETSETPEFGKLSKKENIFDIMNDLEKYITSDNLEVKQENNIQFDKLLFKQHRKI